MSSARAFGLGLLATLGAVTIWGLQIPIGKRVLAEIDGVTLGVLRYTVATLAFSGLLIWREGVAALSTEGRVRTLWLSGGIGICGSVLLVFAGLSLTRPESAAIIGALQPAMAVLAQWFLYRKRPAPFTLACVILAFCGVVLVVSRGGLAFVDTTLFSRDELLGNALVFLGSIAWLTYSLAVAPIAHWSSARVSALTCAFGMMAAVPIWLVFGALGWTRFPASIEARMLGDLLFLALGGALLAILLWNTGLRRIGVLNAVLLGNFTPVVAFAALALWGVEFHAAELLGAGLVVSALIAHNLHQRREASRSARPA